MARGLATVFWNSLMQINAYHLSEEERDQLPGAFSSLVSDSKPHYSSLLLSVPIKLVLNGIPLETSVLLDSGAAGLITHTSAREKVKSFTVTSTA